MKGLLFVVIQRLLANETME